MEHHIHIQEKKIHRIFVISLILKALGAATQIILGALLLLTTSISGTVISLVQQELVDDPNDFFANHLSGIAAHLNPKFQLFGALYLLSHGVIKAFLVWGLMKNKLWAYPASLAVFSLFILYQLAHITRGNWVPLVAFTLFEIFLLVLIWHEYRYLLKKRHIHID